MSGRALRTAVTALVFGVVVVLLSLLTTGAPASAEPPQRLQEQLVDSAGALTDPGSVEASMQQLRDEDGLQLFVAIVDSFEGQDAAAWADETAELSGLGVADPLLVIATAGDYSWSVDQAFELSDAELEELAAEMEPELAAGDFDAGVQTYADGMRERAGAGIGAGSAGTGTGTALGGLLVGGLCIAVVVVVVVLLLRARRRRSGPGGAAPGGPQAPPAESLEDLNTRANRLLVATDEAVRASDRELGFAQAEFGDEATQAFVDALARARQVLVQAFSLRQRLDDSEPETDEQRRQMLGEIVRLCEQADELLDEQTEDFSRLRDVAARIGELLPGLTARADAVHSEVAAETATVEDLTRRFSPTAVQPVAAAPGEAGERVSLAREQLARAAQLTQAGQSAGDAQGEAAVAVRTAEEAIRQAEQLLVGVRRLEADLMAAGNELPRAVAALDADVSSLQQAPSAATPVLGDALAEGRAALAYAEQNGRTDPLGALQRVTRADAAVDAASGQAREAGERAHRAAVALPQALTAAQAEVSAAEDFIASHRGFVGGTARTRVAEAARVLAQAYSLAPTDPVTALAAAARAHDLAQAAGTAARADVGGAQGASWGGGHGVGVPNQTGALIGASILGALLGGGGGGWGGGRGGGHGGGFGGSFGGGSRRGSSGGFGGGRRSGGRSSGGRRGGRGRF